MLSHTYTSVKNANLVDCGKKQHIPSQPFPLLKENFLGEYRTELDKKKVLSNLGIATELSLEWEYIKGDIGKSVALMQELDSRTKYISEIDGFQKTVIEGIKWLESVVGGEEEAEEEQNNRIQTLEEASQNLQTSLTNLSNYLHDTVEVDIDILSDQLNEITERVDNITNLIQISTKEGNAIILIEEGSDLLEEGELPGLYVPDLSNNISKIETNVSELRTDVDEILDTYVTKEDLGGDGDFNFVKQEEYDTYVTSNDAKIKGIETELDKTIKTDEDGHVNNLFVNSINRESGNIVVNSPLETGSNFPLIANSVVNTLEDLYTLDPTKCYAGMSVIVSSQSSLYILIEPADGVIDSEYISNYTSWKCPEDLVIEVLTQEEYDQKIEDGTINPNMFYYIHEEVVDEPRREDYDSEEEYQEALDYWLRVLQQQYMSAVWGQEIEQLVNSKATNESVITLGTKLQQLEDVVESLSGGSDINIRELSVQVDTNTAGISTLNTTDESLQTQIDSVRNSLTDYVTIEEITTENPDKEYIFVKNSAFEAYKTNIANSFSTTNLTVDTITFGNNTLKASETVLLFNDKDVATVDQIPELLTISKAEYDAITPDEDVYYYIYDDDERYVLQSEFSTYKETQTSSLNNMSSLITSNRTAIGSLDDLSTDTKSNLVAAINELLVKIQALTSEIEELKSSE